MRTFYCTVAIVCFGLFSMSCQPKSNLTRGAIANPSDSTLTDETKYAAFYNVQALHRILQQLRMKPDECYLEFVSQQVLPADKALSAWIIPKIVNREEGDLDGFIVLAETETGKIISKCTESEQWVSADGSQFRDASIDTLNFCLSDSRIMFGIRTEYYGSSIDHPFVDTQLKLFAQQADKLLPVFTYEVSSDREDEKSDEGFALYKSKVVVAKQQSKGFYDFALITKMEHRKAGESETDYSINDSILLYSYNGKEYEEVKKSHTAVVYLEQVDESFKKFWLCYGKSMEQAYSIYLSSQETKEAAYLHSMLQIEMPKENLKYVVKGKPVGEENPEAGEYLETEVTYHYVGKGCLTINLEDEYDNRKITITEKKGYTQLIEVIPY